MSDEPTAAPANQENVPIQAPTAGKLLRKARLDAGLHMAALAVSLKVPVKKLQALEEDRLDLLPDAVFVRALAASVCRSLKIDAQAILDLLPKTSSPRLDAHESGINMPFQTTGRATGFVWPAFLVRPSSLVVAAILLGVVAVAFLPDSLWTSKTTADLGASPVKEPSTESTVSASVAPGTTVETTVNPTPQESPLAATAVVADTGVAKAVEGTKDVAIASTHLATATPATLPSASVSAPAQAGGVLVLKAAGESWVEVVDANGVVQVRRILTAQETLGVSGSLPMSVVLGRANAVQVEVRGQAFSLQGISKDNVARFEVK